LKVEAGNNQLAFELQVFLDDLEPNAVRVEMYANGLRGMPPVREELKRVRQLTDGHLYRVDVSTDRPPHDYTARIIPHFEGAAVPLEDTRILWNR
jgi:starch phosphorylase